MKIIKKMAAFIGEVKIYIGASPRRAHGPAIIFFPFCPERLNCGFAGLMTIVSSGNKAGELTADAELEKHAKEVEANALREVLNKKAAAEKYLGGAKIVGFLEKAVTALKEEKAQQIIFFDDGRRKRLSRIAGGMKAFLAEEEKLLETRAAQFASADLEAISGRLVGLKDIQWSLEKDIIDNFDKIASLAGAGENNLSPAAFTKYRKINLLLNALDRLEVRGRDSAGLQIAFLFTDNNLDKILAALKKNNLYEDYLRRAGEGELLHGSVCVTRGIPHAAGKACQATFTYKTFSVVGELGRNVRDLRKAIQDDLVLREFAAAETLLETALTHTRWASVGSITQENCHPVNNYKIGGAGAKYPFYKRSDAEINVVLNGDIDNYATLRGALEKNAELISAEVTTDTKIIPLRVEKYLLSGSDLAEAFRLAVNDFEGSHAIALTSNLEPGRAYLALKGSGQAIYAGISADQYMFASELYGLVEVMPHFVQMNGEISADGDGKKAGQVFVIDQNAGGFLSGITACGYDGAVIELKESDIKKAQITTRDIDRGDYPHFFLKEISQSSDSVRRTLRGKYLLSPADKSMPQVTFNLGADVVPDNVRLGLQKSRIKNIIIIGHGTAAVAGSAVADTMGVYLRDCGINVSAKVASEMSGFLLRDDLSDTLVIPITQSGKTTDTNRAVTMARERGACIISIVNRRQSDITGKSHGVLYTSDGRDIEMSVASTKAFYSQIVAGQILALFFAQLMKTRSDDFIAGELHNLESAPRLMNRVFEKRDEIAATVHKTISKKFWAVVGSGPNKAAADEIRIKLSELCYKTISADIVENKKHIDLSAEPLILVCAAGSPKPVLEDIAKDVAIFRAHKAAVVVFAPEGDRRFDGSADAVVELPASSGTLPVILNALAGHLWGYYAACAIDAEAQIFREFRNQFNGVLAAQIKAGYSLYEKISDARMRGFVNNFYHTFNQHRNNGAFNLLSVKTISDLALLMKYAAGKLPLDDFQQEFKHEEGFASPLDLLDVTLGRAIDELTRPIDAIRHQAKTVTVGTSRKEKALIGIIFATLEKLKISVKNLTYKNIISIGRMQPAISAVKGHTLYGVSNLDEVGNPKDDSAIVILEKGGVARQMKSRAEKSRQLMGTKRTIVSTANVYVGRGKLDGASVLILPLLGEKGFAEKLLLLHIEYNDLLPLAEKTDALGYRYNDIRNMVSEYNIAWRDEYLEKIPLADLFGETIEHLAGRIVQNLQRERA